MTRGVVIATIGKHFRSTMNSGHSSKFQNESSSSNNFEVVEPVWPEFLGVDPRKKRVVKDSEIKNSEK